MAGGGSGRTPPACAPRLTHVATDTNRPAIVAHAATGRADAAEHEHAPGPGLLHESGAQPATGVARRLITGWRGLEAERERGQRAQDRLAVALLIAYVPLFSLVAIDFIMALDAHWFSALLGGYFLTGNLTAGAALLALVAAAGSNRLGLGQPRR